MPWRPKHLDPGLEQAFENLEKRGSIFAVAGEDIPTPAQYNPVRDVDDRLQIKMLQEMVQALVEENGRLAEENLVLRSELERKKGCNG